MFPCLFDEYGADGALGILSFCDDDGSLACILNGAPCHTSTSFVVFYQCFRDVAGPAKPLEISVSSEIMLMQINTLFVPSKP